MNKYGIEILTSLKQREELDRTNKNTPMQNAIRLEMSNIGVAFNIFGAGEILPNDSPNQVGT